MFNSIGLAEKVNFFRLLAVTQKSWLGIRQSLESIAKSESNPKLRSTIYWMIQGINEWLSLSDVMKKYPYLFTDSEIALIKSSETMWNLADTLEGIANELESFQAIRSKIKNSMIYPVSVILLAIVASIYLLTNVMPKIISMFPSQENLPGITLFMLDLSDFLKEYWLIVLAVVFIVPMIYLYLYKNFLPFRIVMDKFYLAMPITSDLVRKFHHYRFAKLLADFYKAGVSPVKALSQIEEILPNWHYKSKINKIKQDLEMWLTFLDSMEGSSMFDPILIQILGVWEKTWNIEIVLEKIANFYRYEFSNKMEWLSKTMEPFLMAFVAWLIGLIVASIFLPLASLINNIWW